MLLLASVRSCGSEDELSRAARAVALLRALGFANAHNGGSPDAVRAALHATVTD